MTNCSKEEKQLIISAITNLIINKQAEHYKKMKNSIWLFLYLLLQADRTSGTVSKKIDTICSEIGQNRETVTRWLNILRNHNYIITKNTGRNLLIQINAWSNLILDKSIDTHQEQDISDSCDIKNHTSDMTFRKQDNLNFRDKTKGPIDISINNKLLKIDIDKEKAIKTSYETKIQKERRELLAYDIAQELDDIKGLGFYLSCSEKYPEQFLRQVLSQVKDVPLEKIKKSRAALFNHLIQKYAQGTSQNFSN